MNKFTNIIGVIVGVIGILLAFYFHHTTHESKELSYNLVPESFKIYDQDLISDSKSISLYKNDSIKIKNSVFLTTFSIWNSGNQPIPPKDIRKDINIKFSGINEILDLKIVKIIDPEISLIKATKLNDSTISLNWKYFDPKDGIKFQLLYTGNPILKSKVDGKILLTSIEEFLPKKKDKYTDLILIISIIITIVLSYALYAIIFKKPLFAVRHIISYAKSENTKKKRYAQIVKIALGVLLLVYLILIATYIYQYYFNESYIPF